VIAGGFVILASQIVRRRLTTLAILAVLFLPAAPQLQSQPSASDGQVPAKRATLLGVKNFGEVTPFLYRGAQPSQAGFKALAGMGVDIVVDTRLSGQDWERKIVTGLGMRYVSIPWHCLFPKDKKIAQFLTVLRNNPKKKVFVHCRYGDDRTGMMIAAYRMAVENWTAEQARKEMQRFGYHRTLCFPLGPYEKDFPDHLRKNSLLREASAPQKTE
jgi:tyrosine-protein phosphatase SIW14